MDPETQNKIAELERKVCEVQASLEKVKKYLLWTVIIAAAAFVLPLIGLLFAIPSFLKTYDTALNGLM